MFHLFLFKVFPPESIPSYYHSPPLKKCRGGWLNTPWAFDELPPGITFLPLNFMATGLKQVGPFGLSTLGLPKHWMFGDAGRRGFKGTSQIHHRTGFSQPVCSFGPGMWGYLFHLTREEAGRQTRKICMAQNRLEASFVFPEGPAGHPLLCLHHIHIRAATDSHQLVTCPVLCKLVFLFPGDLRW